MAALSVLLVAAVAVVFLALSIKVVKQYERGVLFRLGRLHGVREPGLTFIIPFVDTSCGRSRCGP